MEPSGTTAPDDQSASITPLASLASSFEDIASAVVRLADAGEEFVDWITSEATMDEASFAFARALRPEVKGA